MPLPVIAIKTDAERRVRRRDPQRDTRRSPRARGERRGRLSAQSSPTEPRCSDGTGEAEGAKQRAQLRRDAVNRAREDADDGVKQATNDGKTHENTSLSEGPSWELADRASRRSYSSTTKQAMNFANLIQSHRQLE